LTATLAWGRDGGLVAYVDSSEVTTCRTYGHRRTGFRDRDAGDITCTQDLVACGTTADPGGGEINRALADADVVAAFAAAPKLFGKDPRAFDGQVFAITYGGKRIDIGTDCGGATDCTPPSAGVKALADLLQRLDTVQLAKGTCAGKFP
jgi:hypothetical protein